MKSKKKPSTKITAITTINCVQKPPGRLVRKSLTISSPPKPLNAAVNIAAPIRIIKTIEVVKLVSIITFFKTLFILNVLQKLQTTPTSKNITANIAITKATTSDVDEIFLTLS